MDKEDFNNQEKFEKLLNKKSIKSIFSYKDLIGSYENDELDYFKFLISSQMSDSFYSSFDELKRFQNLLKKISKLNDQNLSRESNFLLKLIEEKNFTEEDFKQLQNKYFSEFDKLTAILKSLGEKNDTLIENLPFFTKKDIYQKAVSIELKFFLLMM